MTIPERALLIAAALIASFTLGIAADMNLRRDALAECRAGVVSVHDDRGTR